MFHSLRALLIGAALCVAVPGLSAQNATSATQSATGVLRGTVSSTGGGPLAYAVVTIASLGLQQFSSTQGKFYFTKIPAGKYHLTIRQLGYQAVATDVTLGANGSADIDVKMDRIATRLATMRVLEEWRCTKPGSPGKKGGDLELLEVFEQLEQNAVRLRLLMNEYPFDLRMERRRVLENDQGREVLDGVDTAHTLSSDKSRYVVGKVVNKERMPNRTEQYFLQVPTLLDFAQEEFQKNHCFLLRGIDTTKGRHMIRVDFKASEKIKQPDVEGTVFLDTSTYRLRQTEIRLTKIPADIPGLASLRATTFFDDVVPGMPIISSITAVSDLRSARGASPFNRAVENQSTLSLTFLKKRPESIPPND
ncbi:MAG: carboxypeptidase-like regulatory domain-containing protein [Gemmatimonas sp.]